MDPLVDAPELRDAEAALWAAEWAASPDQRFAQAHAAALRLAALVLRSGPGRPGQRIQVWQSLAVLAPGLAEWSGYFSLAQQRYGRILEGHSCVVTEREADDLMRDVTAFREAVMGWLRRKGVRDEVSKVSKRA